MLKPPLFRNRLAAALCAVSALAAAPAAAQGALCGDRETIVQRLESKYGEQRVGLGVGRENGVVEVYTSARTGTWTILMTFPTGLACLMAAGEAWEAIATAAAAGDGA